jgi:hypothetical protein
MACMFCKSKLHDYRSCPIQFARSNAIGGSQGGIGPAAVFRQSFFGKAPNVFVGRHGYPHVRAGILGAEHYTQNDEPLAWSAAGKGISDIIALRSVLVNSYFKTRITSFSERFAAVARDVSLSRRPVDVEINLTRAPAAKLSFEDDVAPHGPTVELRNAQLTENAPVDTRVDKAVSATDLGAADAVSGLARKGIDEHALTRIFSMGNFGIPTERRLVPTRWSITAVDDILGKSKVAEIKRCTVENCVAYTGGYLGNYYTILFFDDVWQYELFELFTPSANPQSAKVETDYEPYAGRKGYVDETAGGYYAARIGILEHLLGRRRQASVLAIRVITEEYTAPLGVWVCREAVRKTLATRPIAFPDRATMLAWARAHVLGQFRYDCSGIIERSKLVAQLFGQRKLTSF